MLTVKKVNSSLKEYDKVLQIYNDSFPQNEKLPVWLLKIMSKRNSVKFLAFYNENIFCGFTYLVYYKKTTYVFYLAIDESNRSKGYGSQILNWIVENNKDSRIVLNIETVDAKYSNYEQRLRRKKFYIKNGFIDTNYKLKYREDSYDILYKGYDFSKSEYEELLKKFSFNLIPISKCLSEEK